MSDTTQLRGALLSRPDVPDDDIDDVIAIAQELQDVERAAAEGASLEEVEAVTGELDIDPAYVEKALAELTRRRGAAKEAAEERRDAAEERRAAMGRATAMGGAGLVGLLVLGMLWVGAAVPGVRAASLELRSAEAQLHAVIDRQAGLAPQLVSLAGDDAKGLKTQLDAVRGAQSVPEELQASRTPSGPPWPSASPP